MEFWVKFSNKTEERISSVIARIKNYIMNDICNNMKNVKLHVNSLLYTLINFIEIFMRKNITLCRLIYRSNKWTG